MRWIVLGVTLLTAFPLLAENGLPNEPFIEVVGYGSVSVPPDGIKVEFEVTGRGDTGAAARQEADKRLIEVADILESLGVQKGALEAYSLNVSEDWDYSGNERVSLGWFASRSAKLEIRDLERVPEILARLLEAPVEYWNKITPFVDDRGAFKKKVREAAFADAVRRARHYAEMADVELGRVWRMGDEIDRRNDYLGTVTVQGSTIRESKQLPVIEIHDIQIEQRLEVVFLLD